MFFAGNVGILPLLNPIFSIFWGKNTRKRPKSLVLTNRKLTDKGDKTAKTDLVFALKATRNVVKIFEGSLQFLEPFLRCFWSPEKRKCAKNSAGQKAQVQPLAAAVMTWDRLLSALYPTIQSTLSKTQKNRNDRGKSKNGEKRMRKAARNQYICTLHTMQSRHTALAVQTLRNSHMATRKTEYPILSRL